MTCDLYPTPGYPFSLQLRVEYRLGREGLLIASTAANIGDRALPFGIGFHPYFTVGTDVIDTTFLQLPGHDRLVLDDRALPTGDVRSVVGTEFDFTHGRSIGPTRLDTPFGALARDADGLAWATLTHPDGETSVAVWMDDQFSHLMCYTGDTLGDESRRRRGVAIEPMSCPPNALRTGDGLIVLEPGQAWASSWGIRPSQVR